MKKLVLTVAIVLGMTIGASAQYFAKNDQPNQGGGLFGRGATLSSEGTTGTMPLLPTHGMNENQDAAPVGTGTLLLIGFGAAYAISKKKK